MMKGGWSATEESDFDQLDISQVRYHYTSRRCFVFHCAYIIPQMWQSCQVVAAIVYKKFTI